MSAEEKPSLRPMTYVMAIDIADSHFRTALDAYAHGLYPTALARTFEQKGKTESLAAKLLEDPVRWRGILKEVEASIALLKEHKLEHKVQAQSAKAAGQPVPRYEPPDEAELTQLLPAEYVAFVSSKAEPVAKPPPTDEEIAEIATRFLDAAESDAPEEPAAAEPPAPVAKPAPPATPKTASPPNLATPQTASPPKPTASATPAPPVEKADPIVWKPPEESPVPGFGGRRAGPEPSPARPLAEPSPRPAAEPLPRPAAEPLPRPAAEPLPRPAAETVPRKGRHYKRAAEPLVLPPVQSDSSPRKGPGLVLAAACGISILVGAAAGYLARDQVAGRAPVRAPGSPAPEPPKPLPPVVLEAKVAMIVNGEDFTGGKYQGSGKVTVYFARDKGSVTIYVTAVPESPAPKTEAQTASKPKPAARRAPTTAPKAAPRPSTGFPAGWEVQ